jgi:hypothetical protein
MLIKRLPDKGFIADFQRVVRNLQQKETLLALVSKKRKTSVSEASALA